MEGWMIVQIIVCLALILVVMFQPRKAGLGGGMFGGMTRADRSSKFRSLPVLSKLTVVLGVAFLVLSFLFSFLLA
ncbi:MAG TPA: preprotein translocase subunit SecG [Candidatus Atribacteria bacterium]|nr:preprotein translocase subunit SecG [Candidatus Atribacteria bacterium]HPU08540.1 preprotein translocase subunit SecG [Candidatus Atribacteria bacterium]HQE25177.1 preprotein translocase subunit SecG [Candidatus Atribacteria bacterium]